MLVSVGLQDAGRMRIWSRCAFATAEKSADVGQRTVRRGWLLRVADAVADDSAKGPRCQISKPAQRNTKSVDDLIALVIIVSCSGDYGHSRHYKLLGTKRLA